MLGIELRSTPMLNIARTTENLDSSLEQTHEVCFPRDEILIAVESINEFAQIKRWSQVKERSRLKRRSLRNYF